MDLERSTGMLSERTSPDAMLKQVADKVEKTVKPEHRHTYDAIIVAGMKLMWGSPETHQMMVEYLQEAKHDPRQIPKIVAHGIIKMLSIILQERVKAIQDDAEKQRAVQDFMGPSAPAAIVLMTQALTFLQKKMGVPIDRAVVDQTTKAVTQGIFELYDVTPEMIDQAMTQQGQQGQAPAQPAQDQAGQVPAQPAVGGGGRP